jgi:hypothetical protein
MNCAEASFRFDPTGPIARRGKVTGAGCRG